MIYGLALAFTNYQNGGSMKKLISKIVIGLSLVSTLGCKEDSAPSPTQNTETTKSTYQTQFPNIYSAAIDDSSDPSTVTFSQLVEAIVSVLKGDTAFLTSVKGDQGDAGAVGATGAAGAPGAKGDKGDKGDAGSNYGNWENWSETAIGYDFNQPAGSRDFYKSSKRYTVSYNNPYSQDRCQYRLLTAGWASANATVDSVFNDTVRTIYVQNNYMRQGTSDTAPMLFYDENRSVTLNDGSSMQFIGGGIMFWMAEGFPVRHATMWWQMLSEQTNQSITLHPSTAELALQKYVAGQAYFVRLQVRCLL